MVDRHRAMNPTPPQDDTTLGLQSLSEDEWVAEIRKILGGEAPGVRLGIGDDAALVEIGDRLVVPATGWWSRGRWGRRRVDFASLRRNPSSFGPPSPRTGDASSWPPMIDHGPEWGRARRWLHSEPPR